MAGGSVKARSQGSHAQRRQLFSEIAPCRRTSFKHATEFSANKDQRMSKLDLLWLELTAGCNLNCGHCYAESSPSRVGEQHLASDLYIKIIADAAQLGCQRIQFIGGEPTLHNDLPRFLRAAQSARIPHIEVFTNGTRLSDDFSELWRKAREFSGSSDRYVFASTLRR